MITAWYLLKKQEDMCQKENLLELRKVTVPEPNPLMSSPGDSEGQGSLVCCSPWGHKESGTT